LNGGVSKTSVLETGGSSDVFEHASSAISAIYGGVKRDKATLGAEGSLEPYRGIPDLWAGVTQNTHPTEKLSATSGRLHGHETFKGSPDEKRGANYRVPPQ
jgi:hypothetical protein